ncbi:hypothetical protein T261_4342 [Streptomyces lydicus]|nr:hypothetical protein T261_4342 [Streptomyces lydicus]
MGLRRLLGGFRTPLILLSQSGGTEEVLVTLRPAVSATEISDDVLGHLYRTQRLSLVRLAFLLVGDQATAEDVVQDAFTAVCRRWRTLDDSTNALPYIRRAVVNRARSVLRRRRVADAFRPERQHHAESAEETVLLAVEHRTLLAALRQLAPRQREVLVLRYWAGLSEAEIAETMGISRGAVKSMAHRSIAALRKRLED